VNDLPQQLANGVLLGSLYGLIAIGYTMVYGIVQLINFAHGEIFMIGGFGALTAWIWLPDGTAMAVALPIMLLMAIACSTLVGIGAERFAYRPLRGGPRLAPLITAIGLSVALQQAVWKFYPDATKSRTFPQFEGGRIHFGDAFAISRGDLYLLIAAPLCMVALGVFVQKTRTGRAMQATSQDPDTAKLMGINTDRIIVTAFAIGAGFAAIAAIAHGLKYGEINFRMGFIAGLKAFTAAVLGGIGNIYGAMIGGLVLGVTEAMAIAYMENVPGMEQFGGGAWKDVWAFVLLILVLLLRPQGLLGERVADRA
jgi:branched-chain amino acid transport system permease protein